ncbi:MAG TPA: acetate--CoA ligase family protein [Anaerolineaceae bacterium]|nr:acetate--CoA ligase family protein [Anaerolineaceae bacterium]
MNSSLKPFFNPQGVAILGASSKPNKLSYGILENLLKYGYQGGIYPVNPNAQEILGVKVYPELAQVPDPVDLAMIVLPVGMILDTMQECADRGIKAVIIITGGFREVGGEGAEIERKTLEFAREHGMRVVGPNCVGTMDIRNGLNATFIKGMPSRGPIAFISQSGAICGGVVDLILETEIGFSHFASLGNEMDVSEADMLAYFGDDPDVRVIAVYLEGVQDGERFIAEARRVSRIKPIVMLKAGRNNAGARAVSSHTGSLAGSYAAYQAVFKQTGVIEVETLAELFNVAWALGTQKLPKGKRTAITTNAGGAAALLADNLSANGAELAELSADTQAKLRSKLNPSAQVANPVDMLGGAEPPDYLWSLEQMMRDENVDVLAPVLVPQALVDPLGVAQAWVKAASQTPKTMLTCLMGEHSVREARACLNKAGVPVYQYPDQIGPVLRAMSAYGEYLRKPVFMPVEAKKAHKNTVRAVLEANSGKLSLGEFETRAMLAAYGITNVPGDLAVNGEQAVEIAANIGFPVALKIVAEGVLHKSDVGGILLNLSDGESVRAGFEALLARIRAQFPQTGIAGAMVEKMAPKGLEVIVGMRRDPTFGPMMMFGMGGTLVEQVKDIAFRVAPLSRGDIAEMIDATIAGKLLGGVRGSARADIEAVEGVITALSQLALDFPEIEEIEINPLVVYPHGQGALALDSRALLRQA